MTSLLRAGLALAAAVLALAGPARATQVCGWIDETVDADNVHLFSLWLEADGDTDFFYRMAGKGVVTESSTSYSPSSGAFSLRPKRPGRPWSYGTSISGGGDVDIVAEIHAAPKSVFSDDETPLLAKFTFRRHVPEGETKAPKTFAARQCAALPAAP